ncbi:MAG: lysostaphin resistance A-like protein [bacterium]
MKQWIIAAALFSVISSLAYLWLPAPGPLPPLPASDLAITESARYLVGAFIGALLLISVITHVFSREIKHSWNPSVEFSPWTVLGVVLWFFIALGMMGVGRRLAVLLEFKTSFWVRCVSTVSLQATLLTAVILYGLMQIKTKLGGWLLGESPMMTALGRGVLDYIRVYPVLLGGMVANWAILRWLGYSDFVSPQVRFISSAEGVLQNSVILLLVTVIAPIAEEGLFRGILYPQIRHWTPPHSAAILCGLFFAVLHIDPTVIMPLILLGYFLSRTYEKTGSLISATSMHATQNITSMVIFFLLQV